MDRGLVKRVKYSLMRPLAFLLTFLCVFCSSIGVRADETQSDNESDGIVIESVQAVVPQLTAYIRGDHQIGVSDISAKLDGEALTVKSIDFFENMGQDVTYYILLDVSASFSTSYFNALQNSLVTFRSGLSDKDRMVLITFGSSVETVLDGDETDEEAQEKIMSLVNGDNDTYFYEALMQVADETDRNNDNSREVIMMISDGGDDHNTGKANAQESIAALNKRSIPVYGYAAGSNQNNMQSFAELTEACGGTVTDPQKEYNLEFLTGRTNLAKDFEALLAEHEFAPHRTRRNGVKSSASVERILAFMGAAEASARMNAQKAVKQLRNQINRQTNCDTANLGKTARANAQTTSAIRFLQEQGALETLPEVLQQAAAIRMENPDLSLTALCACFDPPVSKSGLSHRMKKLEALAEDLRRRLEENAEKEETK